MNETYFNTFGSSSTLNNNELATTLAESLQIIHPVILMPTRAGFFQCKN